MKAGAGGAHEIVLSYAEGRWHARGAGLALAHAELGVLDRLIVCALAERTGATRAMVRFDLSALPTWLRQYHAHYCNYVLAVACGEERRP